MSDAEIQRQIEEEFPDSKLAKRFHRVTCRLTVNQLRQQYNAGGLVAKAPVQHSFRYNAKGEIVDGRYGRRILTPEEIEYDTQRSVQTRQATKLRQQKKAQILEWSYNGETKVELVRNRINTSTREL